MEIRFDLSHVFDRQDSDVENAYVLQSLLNCLTNVNMAFLKFARASVPRLYESGVRYGRTKVWYPIPSLYRMGYGDCKSLACALVAEYRVKKKIRARSVFRFVRNNRGGNDFHILVETPDCNGYDKKQFEDPSRKLGMGKNELAHF